MQVEQWDAAMTSPERPWAMRSAVERFAAEKHSKAEILESLSQYLDILRSRPGHTDEDEDVVLDTIDALTGWCHPSARLLPD